MTSEEYFIDKLKHSKEEYEFLKKLIIEEEKLRKLSNTWVPGNCCIPE